MAVNDPLKDDKKRPRLTPPRFSVGSQSANDSKKDSGPRYTVASRTGVPSAKSQSDQGSRYTIGEPKKTEPKQAKLTSPDQAKQKDEQPGVIAGWQRGLLRGRQSNVAAGSGREMFPSVKDAPKTDSGALDIGALAERGVGLSIRDEQRQKEEVLAAQEKLDKIPMHRAITSATEAADEADSTIGGIGAYLKALHDDPDTLGAIMSFAAEQAPVAANTIVGTKGAGAVVKGTGKIAQSARVGLGSAFGSVAATYGPNVAEGLQRGMSYDDAEARAAIRSAVQGIIDGTAGAVVPLKIGPNQWTNVPSQALAQVAAGAGGEYAASKAVGDEVSRGEIITEGLGELLGAPGDVAAAVMDSRAQRGRQDGEGEATPDTRLTPPQAPTLTRPESAAAGADTSALREQQARLAPGQAVQYSTDDGQVRDARIANAEPDEKGRIQVETAEGVELVPQERLSAPAPPGSLSKAAKGLTPPPQVQAAQQLAEQVQQQETSDASRVRKDQGTPDVRRDTGARGEEAGRQDLEQGQPGQPRGPELRGEGGQAQAQERPTQGQETRAPNTAPDGPRVEGEFDPAAELQQSFGQEPAAETRPEQPTAEPRPAPQADPEAKRVEINGRPGYETYRDPREVQTDAETYQYKSEADREGVTDRLKGVKRWNPMAAGKVVVHRRSDGSEYVADGHQRLALAKRMQAEGQDVSLPVVVLDEADGWTPEQVRKDAALKNIGEGTGSALDAAKIIREAGDEGLSQIEETLPPNSALVRQAKGLSRLNDTGFQAVVNEQVEPQHAAIVGEEIADPAKQNAALQYFQDNPPKNLDQARFMARDIAGLRESGAESAQQGTLGGLDEVADIPLKERASLLDGAVKRARKDKSIFAGLQRNRERIQQEGNQLADDTNKTIAQQAAEIEDVFTRQITTDRQLNGQLNELAGQVKSGTLSKSEAVSRLLTAARERLGAEGEGSPRPDGTRSEGEGRGEEGQVAQDLAGEVPVEEQRREDTRRAAEKTRPDEEPPPDAGGEGDIFNRNPTEPLFSRDRVPSMAEQGRGDRSSQTPQPPERSDAGEVARLQRELREVEAGFEPLRERRDFGDAWQQQERQAVAIRKRLTELTGDPYGRTEKKPRYRPTDEELTAEYPSPDDVPPRLLSHLQQSNQILTSDATDAVRWSRIVDTLEDERYPEGDMTIYRAVAEGDEIRPGDWVTTDRTYAEEHLRRYLGDRGQILEETVDGADVLVSPTGNAEEAIYAPRELSGPVESPESAPRDQGAGPQFSRAPAEDSPAFRRWFGDSKIVNPDGSPKIVYHGTTGDFDSFSDAKTNVEADFGRGFYFTSEQEDVGTNYAGLGPDLTNKVERTAERLETEQDLDPDVALERAREQFMANEGAVMPVYLKIENPAVVGGKNETTLEMEIVENEEGDLIDERGNLVDFIVNLRDIAAQYDDGNVEPAIDNLLEQAGYESISLSDAITTLKETEEFSYFTDENGDIASSEIIRETLESMGFDGIIDHTVDEKFGSQRRIGRPMEGMGPDTVHYVAFKPTQVKSAVGNRGTFDPTEPSILKSQATRQTEPLSTPDSLRSTLAPKFRKGVLENLEESGWLEIVPTEGDLPAHLQDTRGGIRGVHDRSTGKNYLVAENISTDQAEGVLLHEIGVHYGLRGLLGKKKYNQAIRDVQRLVREGNPRAVAARERVPEGTPEADVAEETLAYLVENEAARKMSVVKRVLTAIRAFMQRMGWKGRLTPETLASLARAAVNRSARGITVDRSPAPAFSGIQTDTPAFKRWFGDSAVVDENGEPLVVYHATEQEFSTFDEDEVGTGSGVSPHGGFFFGDKKTVEEFRDDFLGGGKMMPFYLSMQNPRIVDSGEISASEYVDGTDHDDIGIARQEGHDGVIYRSDNGERVYVAFRPEQIKSATQNRGTFDPTDPNFLRSADGSAPPALADTFYSAMYETLADKLPNKGPADQMLNQIRSLAKKGQFKQEELEWSGIEQWLSERKGRVTKDEVLEALAEMNVKVEEVVRREGFQDGVVKAPKFSEYQLPGGENYRELLIKLPRSQPISREEWNRNKRSWDKPEVSEREYQEMLARGEVPSAAQDEFRGPHFDEPNVLAHVRFNIRTDGEGRSVLFIEEIQSDWHQAGRKKGYGQTVRPEDLTVRRREDVSDDQTVEWEITGPGGLEHTIGRNLVSSEQEAREFAAFRFNKRGMGGVPDAPFKNTWPLLATKRMIRWAAENNIDRIAWTTGEQQAARYDLSKQVDSIRWHQNDDGTYNVGAWQGGSEAIGRNNLDKEGVADLVGKELADKIEAAAETEVSGEFSGVDLKVGGKGMEGFYDNILPKTINKYIKKWGAKAQPTKVQGEINEYQITEDGDIAPQGLDAWGFDVTPDMRKAALVIGQPLYSRVSPGVLQRVQLDEKARPLYSVRADAATAAWGAGAGNVVPTQATMWEDGFDTPTDSYMNLLRYKMQDRYIDLRKIQDSIAERQGPLPDDMNAYVKEELYHGRLQARVDEFYDEKMTPIIKQAEAAGMSMDEAGDFILARHAKERNAQIAKINPEKPDGGSGMTDAEADAILERHADNAEAQQLGEMWDALTQYHRNLLIESGLEKAETVKLWEEAYDHYAPAVSAPQGRRPIFGKGKGFDVRGNQKRATGRSTKPENPLISMMAQYQTTLERAEKAEVGRALMRFIQANPNPDLWEINKPELKPVISRATGLVEYRPDPTARRQDNVLAVKVDGETHFITFNENSDTAMRIARSMKNLGAADSGIMLRAMHRLNRTLAALNTSWNPEFVLSNFFRDIQTAGVNISATDARGIGWRMVRDTPKALNGMRSALFGEGKGKWGEYANEFRKEGGMTGWNDAYNDIDRARKKLQNEIADLQRTGADPRKMLRSLGDLVTKGNDVVENGVRLSAYVHAREMGLSKQKSASLAKNLTVNFNRRGDAGQVMNSLYLFYNASVQGMFIMGRALKTKRARRISYGIIGTAAILDMMNRALGGEDDDGEAYYDKVPGYVKERHLVVMLPEMFQPDPSSVVGEVENRRYIKIPLPYGYNVFHVAGQVTGEALTKPDFDANEAMTRAVGSVVGAFNPLGSDASVTQFISPTILDLPVQIGENQDWAGRPVAPEPNPFERAQEPRSQQYWSTTTESSKWIAKNINKLTGGNEVRPGSMDLSPAVLDHITQFFGGGLGRFMFQSVPETVTALASEDKEMEPYRIPFLRRVYGEVGGWEARQDFYDNLTEIAYAEKEIKAARKEGNAQRQRELEERYSPYLRYRQRAKQVEKRVRSLKEAKERLESYDMPEDKMRDELERLDAEISASMNRFNTLIGRARRGESPRSGD